MEERGFSIEEARKIQREFYALSVPTEEDEFLFTEAMEFLIEEEHDPQDMMSLGGYYYGIKQFDLALKYYEMASELDLDEADEGLGYIWYYGRTGECDYEKAFKYYSRAMNRGNIVCTYKVADMYKNGYYVKKDHEKYVSIIESLYPKVKHARYVNEPLPEIYTRLAKIRTEQGKVREAVRLYMLAKDFLAQRIKYQHFFGNLSIMKWLIEDLYQLIPVDEDNIDFYDLYYLLKKPVKINFVYDGETHEIETSMEEGACVIRFDERWYRTREDFFDRAGIDGERLTEIYDELEDFEIV